MVKLTPELIEQAHQYTNPCRDRELDLRGLKNVQRVLASFNDKCLFIIPEELNMNSQQLCPNGNDGYKIPVVENLGASLDQFDTIDFSDNDIRKLDGFPLLKRLKHLLLNNNRIVRIAENMEECIPHIETLVLTNNGLQELGDIDYLTNWKNLTSLSLMRNPLTTKKNYRLYVIHKLPQVRLLDFRKVKLKEREAAAVMFRGKKGAQLVKDMGKRSKTFTPGAPLAAGSAQKKTGPSDADVEAIKVAIANAKTLEEVERLNQLLLSGQIPGREIHRNGLTAEEEEDMDALDS